MKTKLATAFALCLGLMLLVAAPASAEFGIASFDSTFANSDGATATQAGSHPYVLTTQFKLNTTEEEGGAIRVDGSPRDIVAQLPAGVVGNPEAIAKCTSTQIDSNLGGDGCPSNTQVGIITVTAAFGGLLDLPLPLFNMEPPPGMPAQFGFNLLGQIVHLNAGIRSGGDYGIDSMLMDTSQGITLAGSKVELWGIPADPGHNSERLCPAGAPSPCATGAPLRPFLSLATSCSGPQTTRLSASSWQQPIVAEAASVSHDTEGNPVGNSGCERVPFSAGVSATPTSSAAGAATGLNVELEVPQSEAPGGLATSHLKDAKVVFPAGMTVNAASADGQAGCSPAQIDLHGPGAANCPDASKIGTVEIQTPLLDHPLKGGVYLATQGTNPFNSLLATYLAIDDPETGIVIKLAGKVSPDPQSGQLTATFEDNPQLPFEALTLNLKSGPRAPFVNPPTCGTYTTQAEFTPWARPGEVLSSDSSFTIDEGCNTASQFTPGLQAGTTNPVAGGFSPFTLRVTRPDGQQNISTIQATLPEGVLAKLAGVPLCGDSDAATGSCPAASQIGSATVGVGAGSNPLYVPQPGKPATAVYLAGPYKGAPYSLIAKVPAQAGPFDLGTVAVRNTINIDPTNAQVSVKSDPLPQILQGIPIAYRDIRVDVDRSDFTINPTSCDPMEVKGTIGSAQGKSAQVSDRFQVANCERLAFKPKLQLSVKGPTHRNAHPAFKAVLTMPKGGANIQKAQVTLPKTELLENAHIRTICTRVQYAAQGGGGKACPPASIYGKAKAWSPLLDKPLEGPVYLRSSSHQLPDLVASLDGQIHIDLVGRIDAKNARIRNTFEGVPDAPVSRFVLEMQGGKKGLLANNTELCKTTPRASVKFDAQNGKLADSNPVMRADCGKARKGAKQHRR